VSITSLDIKFRQSVRMTDDSDGGGRMSAVEILDGQTNNVFSDRSDLDGILGRVSLRKFFGAVDTANTDTLLGYFVFLTDPPQDPHVSVCIFNTASSTDERTAARSYVEAYRNAATKSQFILYGRHLIGQQTIQVYCRSEIASPDIGDVLCLSTEADGFDPDVQFVKVQQVANRQTVTFTDASGDFVRDVLILTISTALQFEFIGQEDPIRFTGVNPPPTIVRFTQVVNSAKYYAQKVVVTPLPVTGDLTVRVGDPYIPIVPTTQAETPLVDQLAGLGTLSLVESGTAGSLSLSFATTAGAGVVVTRYLGTPFARGSLSITIGAVTLADDGEGGIAATNPVNTGWSGAADYTTGSFSIARDVGFSATVAVVATPAGVVPAQGFSRSLAITASNRQISYVFQLPGQLAPGTVILDYLALNKWVRLSDNGDGQLAGAQGQGAGTINYATGTVAVTLGALPDVGGALVVAWGTDLRARDSSGEVTIPTPTLRIQLAHAGVVPGSFAMSWVSGGVTKNAAASAAGAVTGDATGAIDCAGGVVEFSTSSALDTGQQYQCTFDYVDPSKVHQEIFTPAPAGHAVSVALAHAPVQSHSVVAQWANTVPQGSLVNGPRVAPYAVHDNGSGGFDGALTGTNTINYTTGAVVLTVDQ
jgi:hypothetical protein